MNMLIKALKFLNPLFGLLNQKRPSSCPYCGSKLIKKNGGYLRHPADFKGIRKLRVQRYQCLICMKTFSEPIPDIPPRARYTRRVIRKSLDMYFHLFASLRKVAEWIRSEINGTERARIWDPLLRAKPPKEKVRLSHVTCWRWAKKAAERAPQEGAFSGIPQSGALVIDATGIVTKGIKKGLLVIADGVKRVIYSLDQIAKEGGEEVLTISEKLSSLGVKLEEIKVMLSDRHGAYEYMRQMALWWAKHQFCVFHLWRNLFRLLKEYKREAGEEAAKRLKGAIKAVWSANDWAELLLAWGSLLFDFSADEKAKKIIEFVGETLPGATVHLSGVVPGLGKTSNVAEWVFRRFKPRYWILQCFMSDRGADDFLRLWQVYMNFHRYQVRKERKRKYPYPGLCPLEIAGVKTGEICWLDVLEV